MKKQPLISVKSALYSAVMGALGCILTLFAIPVGPNTHINLYVLPAVLVGATNGWLLGMLAGAIGSIYTIVLWGHPGSIVYGAILGGLTGLFREKLRLRTTFAAIIAHVIAFPWLYWSLHVWLGTPLPVFWLGMGTMLIQLIASCLITEAIISVPAIRRRIPATIDVELKNKAA